MSDSWYAAAASSGFPSPSAFSPRSNAAFAGGDGETAAKTGEAARSAAKIRGVRMSYVTPRERPGGRAAAATARQLAKFIAVSDLYPFLRRPPPVISPENGPRALLSRVEMSVVDCVAQSKPPAEAASSHRD